MNIAKHMEALFITAAILACSAAYAAPTQDDVAAPAAVAPAAVQQSATPVQTVVVVGKRI